MLELLIALASILLIAVSQLLFKGAMLRMRAQHGKLEPLKVALHPGIVGGLALNGIAAIGWIVALRQLEISYLFPLLSINYLIVPVGAWWFFHERVSRQRKIAIAVICVGVAICLSSRPKAAEDAEPPVAAVDLAAGKR